MDQCCPGRNSLSPQKFAKVHFFDDYSGLAVLDKKKTLVLYNETHHPSVKNDCCDGKVISFNLFISWTKNN